MQKIKSVNVLSVAQTVAIVGGCLPLVIVPIILLFMAFGGSTGTPSDKIGPLVGLGLMAGLCLGYTIIGFFVGALAAYLLNLAAKLTGGIEVDLGPRA